MRVIRGAVVAALVLVQSAAAMGAVAAQDDLDPEAPAVFTYTMELDAYYPSHAPITDSWFIEATDPRASGLLVHDQDIRDWELPVDETDSLTLSSHAFRLTNDGGAWSGTARSFTLWARGGGLNPEPLANDADMVMLTGEGDLEGLTLIFGFPGDDSTRSTWGVIVPTDSIPPVPGLPDE